MILQSHRKEGAAYSLVIFASVLAAFHPTLGNEFVKWDDPMLVYANPRIQSLDGAHLREIFSSFEVGAYTPLSQLSLAVDYALWGASPRGFHGMGLFLHALNACLVFKLARILIGQALGRGNAEGGALIAALLFALHPLRVESVAWAAERRDVLSGFFGLLSALAYVRYASTERRRPFFLLSFFFFVCAMLSKAVVVSLPVIFLLLDLHPFRRPVTRKIFLEKLPFFFVSIGLGWMTLLVLQSEALVESFQSVGWNSRLAQSLAAVMRYWEMLLLPLDLNPLDKLHRLYSLGEPLVWKSLAATGGIVMLLIALARRFPSPLIAGISCLLILGPFLGIAASGFQFTANRYTYFASIPWSILAGGCFQSAWRTSAGLAPGPFRRLFRPAWMGLAIGVCVWFAWLTHRQVQRWKDSETLWAYSLSLDPCNSIAWLNLCDALEQRGEWRRCLPIYKEALQRMPQNAELWNNLGNALRRAGRLESAAEAYRRALAIRPIQPDFHNNYGNVLFQESQFSAALQRFETAAKIVDLPEFQFNMGMCYEAQGDMRKAIRHYERATQIHLQPQWTSAPDGLWLERDPGPSQFAQANAWLRWSRLAARAGMEKRAVDLLATGALETRQTWVVLAWAEAVLRQSAPSKSDLAHVERILEGIERRADSSSQKIHDLRSRYNSRMKQFPAPDNSLHDRSP